MRHPLLFLFLLFLIVPMPAHSRKPDDPNCVPDTGCPAKQGPPKCCEPPECEFWNALEEADAKVRVISSLRLQYAGAESDMTDQEYDDFNRKLNDEIKKIRAKIPKCKSKSKPKRSPPPVFSVKGADPEGGETDCRIMTYMQQNKTFRQLELHDAQRATTACEELVAAKYESADVDSTYCQINANSPEERAKKHMDKAKREQAILEDQLIRYWNACTVAPDFEPAEIITKNSVAVLKKFNFNNKWKGQPAKRAGK